MIREQGKNGLFACPCCGYAVLTAAGAYEVCPLCFWEDDGQDGAQAVASVGGPNRISLEQARVNVLMFGAADRANLGSVRAPAPADEKLRDYQLIGGKAVEIPPGN